MKVQRVERVDGRKVHVWVQDGTCGNIRRLLVLEHKDVLAVIGAVGKDPCAHLGKSEQG